MSEMGHTWWGGVGNWYLEVSILMQLIKSNHALRRGSQSKGIIRKKSGVDQKQFCESEDRGCGTGERKVNRERGLMEEDLGVCAESCELTNKDGTGKE